MAMPDVHQTLLQESEISLFMPLYEKAIIFWALFIVETILAIKESHQRCHWHICTFFTLFVTESATSSCEDGAKDVSHLLKVRT